jgi:hypothetical protein
VPKLVSEGPEELPVILSASVFILQNQGLGAEEEGFEPSIPIKRYCGALVLWLFTGVQKLLQVGVFSPQSHRTCSSLFVRVGVSVGVRTTERLRGSISSRLSGEGVQKAGRDPCPRYCLNVSPMTYSSRRRFLLRCWTSTVLSDL